MRAIDDDPNGQLNKKKFFFVILLPCCHGSSERPLWKGVSARGSNVAAWQQKGEKSRSYRERNNKSLPFEVFHFEGYPEPEGGADALVARDANLSATPFDDSLTDG